MKYANTTHLLIRTYYEGNVVWIKTLPVTEPEVLNIMIKTSDGGQRAPTPTPSQEPTTTPKEPTSTPVLEAIFVAITVIIIGAGLGLLMYLIKRK